MMRDPPDSFAILLGGRCDMDESGVARWSGSMEDISRSQP